MTLGTVLVTGGASGLGADAVEPVSAAGGRPIPLNRSKTRYSDGSVADVTCAGIDAGGRLGDTDPDGWDRVVDVNLLGTAAVVRAVLPDLTARVGRIVTAASTLGLRALSDATAYCASKFGVVGFTRALAVELQGQVGVTLLVPGGIRTALCDGRAEQYQSPPDAKLNEPGDVAAAVVFAVSQPSGCMVRELVITPSVEPSWP